MKNNTQSKAEEKRYSLNTLLGVLCVAVFAAFIIGTVFGLKISGSPKKEEIASDPPRSSERVIDGLPSFEERTRSTPEKEAAWNRAMAERRAEIARENYSSNRYTPTRSSGSNDFNAYRPAAEDVSDHWERETGRPMSQDDVRTIQGIMKALDE